MMKQTRYKIIGFTLAVLCLMFSTQTVSAHDGEPPAPHDLWGAWNWDPIIVMSLAASAWIYVRSLGQLKQRAHAPNSVLHWRAISFTAGMLTLFVALISPLDALSAALFSAHMLQHILLLVIAPPLLVLGVSPVSFLLAFDLSVQRKLGQWWEKTKWLKSTRRALIHLSVAWTLSALMLWVWHVPRLYETALRSAALHTFEHLSFMIPSLIFWWTIIHPRPSRAELGVLALFTMMLQGSLLGALIAFAPTPWYESYASTTQAWGLSPLEDQQLAGAIMWIPVGTIYTLAALILFMLNLAQIERRAYQRDHE
jgi:putative membrane protein